MELLIIIIKYNAIFKDNQHLILELIFIIPIIKNFKIYQIII